MASIKMFFLYQRLYNYLLFFSFVVGPLLPPSCRGRSGSRSKPAGRPSASGTLQNLEPAFGDVTNDHDVYFVERNSNSRNVTGTNVIVITDADTDADDHVFNVKSFASFDVAFARFFDDVTDVDKVGVERGAVAAVANVVTRLRQRRQG